MEFRKATLLDADTLSRLRSDMFREEEEYPESFLSLLHKNTKQYIENGLADHSFSAWVAVEGGAIIAMGGVAYFTLPPNDWCPGGKTAYVGNMYTLPTHRKQGIASRLLSLILEEAKELNCQRVLLNTSDMGRPLYEKSGFSASPTAMALYPLGIKQEA